MKAVTSLDASYSIFFCISKNKKPTLLLLKAASSDVCARAESLMVLCPVYGVYNVLADISIPLGEKHFIYLQSRGTRTERVKERDAQAERGEGWNIKSKRC